MWLCSQIGAREHYSVPRALYRDKRLACLYTDFWAGTFVRQMARTMNAKAFRSLATRFHPELSGAPVVSWNARSLGWEAGLRRQGNGSVYGSFIKIGNAFAQCVRDALKQRNDLNPGTIFFAYDTGALETMEWCRERGIRCLLNQMDPNRIEVEMVREEEKRWPGWTLQSVEVPEEYFRRREKEWALADRVVVNSDFCAQALVKQGVPPEKLAIVPLCFESGVREQSVGKSEQLKNKLRVLYLGQVILRKGIQYLIEAAKLLEDEPVQFDIVGPVGISEVAVASAPKNMTFHGRATRDQTADWYRQSDVFVLPTLSDGFAITQLEAMSYGLPVVATPSCGAVVSDGVDGFIVPSRNADALAKTFQRYMVESGLRGHQSNAALAKVRQFTLNQLTVNLRSLEQKVLSA
jgi:glycosyltransferase involved in cell wall biosynthesis